MEPKELKWLCGALGLSDHEDPFPWQQELLKRFTAGTIESALDIPTGLGKTSVMAVWLVARALGADLPRRLAYVVDRRAVVDQATDVATQLREYVDSDSELKRALSLGKHSLPISTLRGRHIDNKEWLEDPASPAIIVGTVDMIGSRLLFEGYGTSRKMRPYQAGLLGADVLLALDEAHLVPPFEKLLRKIASDARLFGPRDEALRKLVPSFRLLTLSATARTARSNEEEPFVLTSADLEHPVVSQRLNAEKRLTHESLPSEEKLPDALAKRAWSLAEEGKSAARVIVFCDKPKDAEKAKQSIEKLAKGDKEQGIPATEAATQLFVGGRRVYEREQAAKWLREHGFLTKQETEPPARQPSAQGLLFEHAPPAAQEAEREFPAFVFATSAGEVGVDMDADHMACDLVAWERMVQRLGRVNRRGGRVANVVVVHEKPEKAIQKQPGDRTAKESKEVERYKQCSKRLKAIESNLPCVNGFFDASTGAIRSLKNRAGNDPRLKKILDAATTPDPLQPELSRALVDAWSMTSLEEHTGRPNVQPWLRGWTDDPPQTTVIWRKHLPVRTSGRPAAKKEIEDYFEAAPPHLSEKLETETDRVAQWLFKRTEALLKTASSDTETASDGKTSSDVSPLARKTVVAIAISSAGDVRDAFQLEHFDRSRSDTKDKKKKKDDVSRVLAGATLVVDARVAGLQDGRLDSKAQDSPRTADDGKEWIPTGDKDPIIRFRVRKVDDTVGEPYPGDKWRQCFRFATKLSNDGEEKQWLIVDKWRHDSSTEDGRAVGPRKQLLKDHQQWTKQRAMKIAERLGLPQQYAAMLAAAARIHDEGKRAKRWQRAFNAPGDGIYAKTPGPIQQPLLGGYRHEFGSFLAAERNGQLSGLSPDLRDLALHLIAAHHGFARPLIRVNGCDDAPPSALEEKAMDVALRFARLQKRWGPWGLAWWESLLRAADRQASRDNKNDNEKTDSATVQGASHG